jgi:hypothetical protein
MKEITAHLKNQEIREAVILLQAAKESFTEEPILMDARHDEEEEDEDGDKTERNLVDTMKAVFMGEQLVLANKCLKNVIFTMKLWKLALILGRTFNNCEWTQHYLVLKSIQFIGLFLSPSFW